MKFSIILSLTLSSTLDITHGDTVCNENDHHPTNGGYYIEAANGYKDPREYDPVTNEIMWDATWATGNVYKDGKNVICTGMFCSPICTVAPGCPNFMLAATCAQVRFCYEEDSGDDVWLMPNPEAQENCDFSGATQVCDESGGSGETCCNYQIEHDAPMEDAMFGPAGNLYFASKKNCNEGVQLGVEYYPFEGQGTACQEKGKLSLRIKDCECPHQLVEEHTLSEPCFSGFKKGCEDGSPDDDSCCDDAPPYCVNKSFNIDHPWGKKYEKDRKSQCVNWKAGRCLPAWDFDRKDCCKHTCEKCGIKRDPFNVWDPCKMDMMGNISCGLMKKHGAQDTCDFTECEPGDRWHPDGDEYKAWVKRIAYDESEYSVFLMKEKNDQDNKVMTCGELAVHKKFEKYCRKKVKMTSDHKSAEMTCQQTCDSGDVCYENENTIVYRKMSGEKEKTTKCKLIAKMSADKIEQRCNTESMGLYPSAADACPVTCGNTACV